MSLATTVQNLVKIADSLTKPFQVSVRRGAFKSQETHGDGAYAYSQVLAIVEKRQRQVMADGKLTVSTLKLTFPRALSVHVKDTFELPDGSTGPTLNVDGLLDPSTGQGFITEVYLG